MSLITAADLNTEMDYLLQAHTRLATGYANALSSMTNLDSLTFTSLEARADITPANVATKAKMDALGVCAAAPFIALLNKIERHAQREGGYTSLDAFLTALNPTAGTKWTSLHASQFRALFEIWKGTGNYPSAWNLYQEVLQGATYVNALGKLVVSGATFTAGATINTSNYAGGVPYVVTSGFTGASDTVTVTGTQYNPATRTATTGKTWTATVAGNGSVALAPGGGTPAATDSLIAAVSAIAAGGLITAGTMYIEARRPSGRVDVTA